MNKFQNSLLIIFIISASLVSAQDYKFGKVPKEELQEKFYVKDSSAAAVVLYRNNKLRYQYTQGVGFKIITDVHERIKIYNKEGFEYATISQMLFKSGGNRESVSRLKAFTYNLEKGDIVKSKMEKSSVFSTSLSDFRDEEKFTLPNLKEGSVIEYEYQVSSPFYYYLDEIVLQYDIPIKKQDIGIETPEYFVFKPNMKGYLGINPKVGKKTGKISFTSKSRNRGSYSSSTSFKNNEIDYLINTTKFVMEDVPALKEEPYVNHMDNYRSAIKYELQYVQFPQSVRENYSTTWEKVVKKIYESDNFGNQLKSSKYYEDDLASLTGTTGNEVELATAIFHHVKNKMSWNGNYGYYTEKGVKNAYKESTGNVADINLVLTSMLVSAGLEANPVLVSTRDNGVPLFPTREGFNYVIASVRLGDGLVLLDATNKYTKPNLLPTRALNWFGKLIKKDGTFSTVNLISKKVSRENVSMIVKLFDNGDISGKCRTTYVYYDTYKFRNKNASIGEDDYLEKLENENGGMEISDYTIKNKMTIGKPVMESFSFDLDGQADVIGDKIYFSPLLHMTMDENPFKLEERRYPVDFTYPWQKRYTLNIDLPIGYEMTSKPEDVHLALDNNLGSFKCQVLSNGKSLQVLVDLKMNEAVIAPHYYGDLKELFKNTVEKQTEKVVLSKIISDGTSAGPGKGR